MKSKAVLVYLVLILFCLCILQTAQAQATVGVSIGNSFAYEFSAYFRTENPNATIPEILQEDNMTEWVRFTISDIQNLTLSHVAVQHLLNGTENTSSGQEDIGTGDGSFPIIRANVSVNEPLFPSLSSSPTVNETIVKNYPQVKEQHCTQHGTTLTITSTYTLTSKQVCPPNSTLLSQQQPKVVQNTFTNSSTQTSGPSRILPCSHIPLIGSLNFDSSVALQKNHKSA